MKRGKSFLNFSSVLQNYLIKSVAFRLTSEKLLTVKTRKTKSIVFVFYNSF